MEVWTGERGKGQLSPTLTLSVVRLSENCAFLRQRPVKSAAISWPNLDATKAAADAHSSRSLNFFEDPIVPIVHSNLSSLCPQLNKVPWICCKNSPNKLCKLMDPFSGVQIAHITELIESVLWTCAEKCTFLRQRFEARLTATATV
ncbi:hypothetical protein JHK84_054658 [Glycine max]|nr:hypothetical protein JHK86_054636 [Glycine max]KAG5073427.1 hypothetical protein JHK84_054658 [Glycine max]